ncbi:MAG: hypothetical protein QOE11_3676 [Solirubrobacteraceae bacterium]|nr:hypothetical protein [Solirubrobacteraceae bacterium]
MPDSELQEVLALALVFVVHVIGGLALVWALLDDDMRARWRRGWGRGGDEPGPVAPAPRPSPALVPPALPLAGADLARVRLRGPGRLADAHPAAPRRPEHAPEPARVPQH